MGDNKLKRTPFICFVQAEQNSLWSFARILWKVHWIFLSLLSIFYQGFFLFLVQFFQTLCKSIFWHHLENCQALCARKSTPGEVLTWCCKELAISIFSESFYLFLSESHYRQQWGSTCLNLNSKEKQSNTWLETIKTFSLVKFLFCFVLESSILLWEKGNYTIIKKKKMNREEINLTPPKLTKIY